MQFQEIYNRVVELTDHPELVKETEQAILRSTLRMHSIDWFQRDLKVIGLNATGGRTAQISVSSFPRLRKIKWIQANTNNNFSWPVKLGTEEGLINQHKNYDKDVAFNLGAVISIRCSKEFSGLTVAYYEFPRNEKDDYSSWISELYPYAIIDDAAATVLYLTGDNEQGAALRNKVGSKERPERDTHIHTILSEQLPDDGMNIE